MFQHVRKRDGRIEEFREEKIVEAIFKAARACGGQDRAQAERLCKDVLAMAVELHRGETLYVEDIQNLVERALIKGGHARTAKAFILYREKRRQAREENAVIGATIETFGRYLEDRDWMTRENANTQRSVNGLNNYVREAFTKAYWLHEVYPAEVRETHESGEAHIHDLGFLGPYCAGWDLGQILAEGFGGVPGKLESRPARHLRSFLGQVVNLTFTLQGEMAGAQAWSSFDTYCAPFIRHDGLNFEQVRQCLQEFVFNLNVPTRVGFQCPFSNLTFDIAPPAVLKDKPAIIGGATTSQSYGDYQEEMNVFNRAFCDVMMEGDAKGRVFTFPIPTLNITRGFNWDLPAADAFIQTACKYGIPYFANYVNSDLDPVDAVSMCCRLRIDTSELRRRGGGLFGSNPLTGSIGVFTINLPRIGYLSKSPEEFRARLRRVADIGKTMLEIKRKTLERQTENGLYPYSARYLRDVKRRTGGYWTNHFSTLGVVGMNEALRNFVNTDLTKAEGQAFALEILDSLREQIAAIQTETGNLYNLEATPAEGAAYRLAKIDHARFPDIITAGKREPYYTNSSHLPVGYTTDVFETLQLQDALQSKYTGGTVLHLYLGERIEDPSVCMRLIQRIFEGYRLPYLSLTPTFSVCPDHGYIAGEHFKCPTCGSEAEVWSRVTGYLRPVQNYNDGKKEEYRERAKVALPREIGS